MSLLLVGFWCRWNNSTATKTLSSRTSPAGCKRFLGPLSQNRRCLVFNLRSLAILQFRDSATEERRCI
ncbi:hypothetical protein I7I50_01414 [Histoplasma capsulatum G186AR]|uniref:Uncharacterized protein n=1 Tax=Ajellomyces capsulatus TaxID=5037 RepID=A0A8H7YD67_AJECA|nr:hypothetical protein I7I52_12530 [Histoplasma capsulatum]QSS73299.1 hypothetical protein I7I50_01414 [Histoplasma capsulatum G186AR]